MLSQAGFGSESLQRKKKACLIKDLLNLLRLPSGVLCGLFYLIGNVLCWARGNVCRDFIVTMKRNENQSSNWSHSVHLAVWWTPRNCNRAERNSVAKLFFETWMGENMEEWHAVLALRLCLSRGIRLQSALTYALRTQGICLNIYCAWWHAASKCNSKNAVRILGVHPNIPVF